MLIVALVLALIGLVALVFAVVTSNELVAWVCIGASVLGVVLLIIDALREHQRRDAGGGGQDEGKVGTDDNSYVDYPEEAAAEGETAAGGPNVPGADVTKESTVPADRRGDQPTR
jgi:hypothetical protein